MFPATRLIVGPLGSVAAVAADRRCWRSRYCGFLETGAIQLRTALASFRCKTGTWCVVQGWRSRLLTRLLVPTVNLAVRRGR